jgi:hypothetical protein
MYRVKVLHILSDLLFIKICKVDLEVGKRESGKARQSKGRGVS